MAEDKIILGIDPGTTIMGFGLIKVKGKTMEFLQLNELLLQKYDLWVSSATVRNDMWKLENLDLIYQPYNSAWRLPTSKWLRAFVNYLMQSSPDYFLAENNLSFWNDKIEETSYKIGAKKRELNEHCLEISKLKYIFQMRN